MEKLSLPYHTKFDVTASILKPSKAFLKEASASLKDLQSIFPNDIDPETDPDILYIVANLAVAGVLNLNDDGVSIEQSLSIYKKFEKKQVNVEHDRDQTIGFILKSGLSKFGTDEPITEEEAKSENKPFNITVVIVLWKIKAKELCDFLVKESGEDGNDKLSLSFEVGFDKYEIIELSGDNSDFNAAQKIIFEGSTEYNSYDMCLKANNGSGKKNGNRVGRCLSGNVVPLGAGVVTTPAAAVKGVLPITEKTEDKQNLNTSANPFDVPTNKPYTVPANMKTIKLSDKENKELKEKFASITYKYADVNFKNGKTVKLARYEDGMIVIPGDSDFEHDDILHILPSEVVDQTLVDNSDIVHPRLDKEFPNVNKETQEKDKKAEETRELLRKQAYKDASGKLMDLFDKLIKIKESMNVSENNLKNGVLKTTNDNNIMKIEKLTELKASLAKGEDAAYLKESFANAILFAEELAKESEKMVVAAEKEKKEKETLEATKKEIEASHASLKKEYEALVKKVKDMEDEGKMKAAKEKFQARMSKLEAKYDMDDGCRAFIASDIKDLDDEEYASYEQKMDAFMKEKSKTYKNELAEKMKAALSKKNDDSDKKDDKKDDEKKDDEKKDETDAEMDEVMASAKNNEQDTSKTDKEISKPNIDLGRKSLKDQYKEAFGSDIKIGGVTLNELEKERQEKLKA